MASTQEQGELFVGSPVPSDTVVLNGRCLLRTRDGRRVVVVAGLAIFHYAVGDRMAEAHAMVTLVEQGWATQVEVADAFGCATRSVRRHLERFEQGGLAALGRRSGFPRDRPRISAARSRLVHRLKSEGLSNCAIASRIGVTEKAVRKSLRRLGWRESRREPALLPLALADSDPNLSAFSTTGPRAPSGEEDSRGADPALGSDPNLSAFATAPAHPKLSGLAKSEEESIPRSFDRDPADRRLDRLFACLGLLEDAAPLFRPGVRVPRAGVLLSVPVLLSTGVLDCAREVYGSLGPAFYGLRTTVVALLLMALLRIKRAESLKEHSPEDLGRLLGLDRAPEVKTLRRKLARLAKEGRAASFGRALARRRVATHGAAMGFLYADGHVRVYHGSHSIPQAHVARMRICSPATTDYWVNDELGEPLFVVTAEANAGLAKMLPILLVEVRRYLGERPVTIVFDRGGWSPKLFKTLIGQCFDILTYRKGTFRRVARRHFREHVADIDGRKIPYMLADQNIRLLEGKLRLRQVTRLSPNGHQTPIITSRFDLATVEVAYRMFERWRQENFFKYLREEYALDALVQHAVEEDNPEREVPNPLWNKLTAELRKARAEATWLASNYGVEALDNVEQVRRTMRGFKIANAEGGRAVEAALRRVARLETKRRKVPRRVPVREVVKGPVVRLAAERQHLASLFKMTAYQAESDLANRLRPYYPRAEQEGRTLVQTALSSAADIEVTATELLVTLAPLSSKHRSRAVAALCEDLSRRPVCFPGTRLKMRFAVAPDPQNRTNP